MKLGIGLRHAAEGSQVIANVSRTGSTAAALNVALTSLDVTEATVPATVTIPAGASRATFFINTVQDQAFDLKQVVQLVASATGYTSANNTLDVEDNPALTLLVPSAPISENGGTKTVTLVRSFVNLERPLTVQLTASNPGSVTMPASITFAANQHSVTFNVTAIDNTILEGNRNVNITATSASHGSASDSLTILDEEILALEIDKSSMSERGGQATLTVRRLNTNIETPLTVTLVNSSPSQATLPGSIEIPASASSATVFLNAIDDDLLDGSQSVSIEASAAGYVPRVALC